MIYRTKNTDFVTSWTKKTEISSEKANFAFFGKSHGFCNNLGRNMYKNTEIAIFLFFGIFSRVLTSIIAITTKNFPRTLTGTCRSIACE
jgi:hypothetical protein